MTPYVNVMTSMLEENVLMMKKAAATMLPQIVTIRHPNLFAKAPTIGPTMQINVI